MSNKFYPTISCGEIGKYSLVESALLPVSSWAGYALRQQKRKGLSTDYVIGSIPVPKLPPCMVDVFADCGGFVATNKWGGVYKYTQEQYIEWLEAVKPVLAAMRDYCCENEITSGRPGIVRERQQATTKMAYETWKDYKHASWVWVPTIQGWTVEDYIRHAQEMKPLIEEMQAYYRSIGKGDIFRVGIGTLCARADAEMIRTVIRAVRAVLGNVKIHGWGVKLGTFLSDEFVALDSFDSGAWNGMWGSGRNLWKGSGMSQREWCFKVALPRYEAKIMTALGQLKQMSLEDIVA